MANKKIILECWKCGKNVDSQILYCESCDEKFNKDSNLKHALDCECNSCNDLFLKILNRENIDYRYQKILREKIKFFSENKKQEILQELKKYVKTGQRTLIDPILHSICMREEYYDEEAPYIITKKMNVEVKCKKCNKILEIEVPEKDLVYFGPLYIFLEDYFKRKIHSC